MRSLAWIAAALALAAVLLASWLATRDAAPPSSRAPAGQAAGPLLARASDSAQPNDLVETVPPPERAALAAEPPTPILAALPADSFAIVCVRASDACMTSTHGSSPWRMKVDENRERVTAARSGIVPRV